MSSCNAQHKYRVVLTNGDEAETDTFAGVLTCVRTLCDGAPNETVAEVYVGDKVPIDSWAWRAAMEHLIETDVAHATQTAETDLAEDR